MSAGTELRAALDAALAELALAGGLHAAEPERAPYPHGWIDAGPETDWGHKSGAGREVRLAMTIADVAPSPVRLHALMDAAEEELAGFAGPVAGWRLVSLHLLRTRAVRDAKGVWKGVIEFRARLLAGA